MASDEDAASMLLSVRRRWNVEDVMLFRMFVREVLRGALGEETVLELFVRDKARVKGDLRVETGMKEGEMTVLR